MNSFHALRHSRIIAPYLSPRFSSRSSRAADAASAFGAVQTGLNPLEVLLAGSGFYVTGVMVVLRMVRDWSSQRRSGAAAAGEAEARADLARAQARRAWTEADILSWLAEQARAGRGGHRYRPVSF
jgi:hypothetical protein